MPLKKLNCVPSFHRILKKSIFLVLTGLLSGIPSALAQADTSSFFHELEINGIPFNKKANVIFEDSFGFLWIGTDSGLFRYDGNALLEFQYDVFDKNSIPNNSINSIVEDANKNLWIGTESYLVFYDRGNNRFKGHFKDKGPLLLGKSSDGLVWANLKKKGLLRISPHKEADSIQFHTKFDYGDNQNFLKTPVIINAFMEDSFGRHWIGSPEGIFALDQNDCLRPTNFKNATKILMDNGDNTFFAVTDDGVHILGYNKVTRHLEILERYIDFLKHGDTKRIEPTSLALDSKEQKIWVGTTEGLFCGNRKNNTYNFEFFGSDWSNKRGLLNNQISTTILDRYGNLWIGSLKGVNKQIGRASIFEYHEIDHLGYSKNAFAKSLYFDKGTVWAGISNNGLYRYDTKTNTGHRSYAIQTNINFIRPDFENKQIVINDGPLLLQSKNFDQEATLIRFETLKKYNAPIEDAFYLNHNELWVGLWNGGGIDIINPVDGPTDFKKRVMKSTVGSHTSVLLKDDRGNVWIGTRGKGLYQVDLVNEKLNHFLPSESNGLNSNAILCLLQDTKNNVLWIGTRGGGLNVYDYRKKRFTSYGKEQGLLSNTVAAIEQDNEENLWLSTRNGLARFDVANKKFVAFGIEDGITENHFFFKSSAVKKANGNVFFGCRDGFYKVRSQNFQQTDLQPNTVITAFTILGEEMGENHMNHDNNLISKRPDEKEPLTLPYEKNNILLEFSSLDLTAPTKNEYAYMLEGVNDYWIYSKASNRSANYSGLSPGDYTFKVKSSNSDGVWNESPAILKFTVTPPFWLSPWAYLIYVLLAASFVWVTTILVRRWYRMKKHLVTETVSRQKDNEHHRMKMVFFTDISHELRTPLTLIQGTIEKVMRHKSFSLSPLTAKQIHNNALRMGRLINQIMDIRKFDVGGFKINVSKNDIVKNITELKNAFNDFAKIHQIDYTLKIDQKEIMGWYDTGILEKILFNLLSNAFKFTPEGGKITVSLRVFEVYGEGEVFPHKKLQSGKYMRCSVKDNGVGISKKDLGLIFDRYYQSTKIPTNQIPGTGIGMELVHKLIENHHGAIKVESEEQRFTEFTFALPIQKEHYSKYELQKGNVKEKRENTAEEPLFVNSLAKSFTEPDLLPRNGKPIVLLVEDNPELRGLVKEELLPDFYVLEAENGKEAYDLALKEGPQLIISDILMPVEDGISLLRRLKNTPEVSHIPVFMLTAKDSHQVKIECLGLGADDYIEKPFSLEFVKWKVKNILSTRKQLKEKYSKIITAEPSEKKVVGNDEKFIKKLIKIIEDSMDDTVLNVEYLASEVGMSRANLYRKLQAILNETPVNFIKQIRLKRAAQLLKGNTLYISEVAYMTGFSNQKYFSKCFSSEFGMSPTEYIKQYAAEPKEHACLKVEDFY